MEKSVTEKGLLRVAGREYYTFDHAKFRLLPRTGNLRWPPEGGGPSACRAIRFWAALASPKISGYTSRGSDTGPSVLLNNPRPFFAASEFGSPVSGIAAVRFCEVDMVARGHRNLTPISPRIPARPADRQSRARPPP